MRLIIALVLCLSARICLAQTRIITVAADGSGDWRTVQDALAAAPAHNTDRIVIHIAPGTYAGPNVVGKDKPNITLPGDDPATTILKATPGVAH